MVDSLYVRVGLVLLAVLGSALPAAADEPASLPLVGVIDSPEPGAVLGSVLPLSAWWLAVRDSDRTSVDGTFEFEGFAEEVFTVFSEPSAGPGRSGAGTTPSQTRRFYEAHITAWAVEDSPHEFALYSSKGGDASFDRLDPWTLRNGQSRDQGTDHLVFDQMFPALERREAAPRYHTRNVALSGDDVRGRIHGDELLHYFYGFTVEIRHSKGVETFHTGLREGESMDAGVRAPEGSPIEDVADVIPLPWGDPMRDDATLVLRTSHDDVRVATGSAVGTVAATLVKFDGVVDFRHATATLTYPDGIQHVRAAPVRLAGQLNLGNYDPDSPSEETGHSYKVTGNAWAPPGARQPDPSAWADHRGALLAGASATAAGLLVLAGILYSRLREDEVTNHPERRRILEAVAAAPGNTIDGLAETGATTRDNVRYHIKVLRQRRLVRAVRVQGQWRFFIPKDFVPDAPQRMALEADPKLRDVVARAGDGVPVSELVQHLCQTWGLSRSGGWLQVERAVKLGVAHRTEREGRLILTAAAPSPGNA